ncbi:MAG: ribonucleotide reductase N-terminal alpha domain-containing protein, partial [Oceanibaculum sp.]
MSSLAFDFDYDGNLVPQTPGGPSQSRPAQVRPAQPRPVQQQRPRVQPPEPDFPHQQMLNLERRAPLPYPLAPRPTPADLKLDRDRDALLTNFGKATLTDRYLLAGESFQDMFARVSCAFADDIGHAQRLYDAMSRLW